MRVEINLGTVPPFLADEVRTSPHTGGTSVWLAAKRARDMGFTLEQAEVALVGAYVSREDDPDKKAAQEATGRAQIRRAYSQPAGARGGTMTSRLRS